MNFVDTADVYSRWVPGHAGGESETIIGKWLAPERQARPGRPRDQGRQADGRRRQGPVDRPTSGAPSRRRCGACRPRSIDLYQSHDDDAETPLEETLGAFAELIKEGKVRAIGASNYSAPRLARSARPASRRLGLPRYESLQPLYNLVERAAYESELEPVCATTASACINFFAPGRAASSPASTAAQADLGKSARGGGAGKYLNAARPAPCWPRSTPSPATIGATPAQVALAWQIAPAEHHRADRQRDLAGAARRAGRRGARS